MNRRVVFRGNSENAPVHYSKVELRQREPSDLASFMNALFGPNTRGSNNGKNLHAAAEHVTSISEEHLVRKMMYNPGDFSQRNLGRRWISPLSFVEANNPLHSMHHVRWQSEESYITRSPGVRVEASILKPERSIWRSSAAE